MYEDAVALIAQLPVPQGAALVATGSFARNEMTRFSDLDLLLILPDAHLIPEIEIERIWSVAWNSPFHLDYAVRTVGECVDILGIDMTAALAMIEMTYVAGDADLALSARRTVLRKWQGIAARHLSKIVNTAIHRWRHAGSIVSMTRPDIKLGRGGLRDLDLIHALALGNVADEPDLRAQRDFLINVRRLLHEAVGRKRDILDPEYAADIAAPLGLSDRFEVEQCVVEKARKVDEALTGALRIARGVAPPRRFRGRRTPLDVDVVEADGEIALAKNTRMDDPGLTLRVAASAARTGLPVTEKTWAMLTHVPGLPDIFPPAVVEDFYAVLAFPETTPSVIEELDRWGLWEKVIPSWPHARGRIPREPSHIHTVDKHSIETVAGCARLMTRVPRPDLLLLAALFHDLGKGYGRPHAEVGAELVADMARRLRLDAADQQRVKTIVEQHITLARVIMSCDPESDKARTQVLKASGFDYAVISALAALTEADAKATGPGVWCPQLDYGLRLLVPKCLKEVASLEPQRPDAAGAEGMKMEKDEENGVVRIITKVTNRTELFHIFSVIAAKAWVITECRVVTEKHGTVLNFSVRPTVHSLDQAADKQAFVLSLQSGVYKEELPQADLKRMTVERLSSNVVEIRAIASVGSLARIVERYTAIDWLAADVVGATLIVRIGFTSSGACSSLPPL